MQFIVCFAQTMKMTIVEASHYDVLLPNLHVRIIRYSQSM